jgi:hypothetical protein
MGVGMRVKDECINNSHILKIQSRLSQFKKIWVDNFLLIDEQVFIETVFSVQYFPHRNGF